MPLTQDEKEPFQDEKKTAPGHGVGDDDNAAEGELCGFYSEVFGLCGEFGYEEAEREYGVVFVYGSVQYECLVFDRWVFYFGQYIVVCAEQSESEEDEGAEVS